MDYGGSFVVAANPGHVAANSNPVNAYFNKSTFEVEDYEPAQKHSQSLKMLTMQKQNQD